MLTPNLPHVPDQTRAGLWREDPGPQGVYLRDFDRREIGSGKPAPAGWKFDPNAWWVEEHGEEARLAQTTASPWPAPQLRSVKPASLTNA